MSVQGCRKGILNVTISSVGQQIVQIQDLIKQKQFEIAQSSGSFARQPQEKARFDAQLASLQGRLIDLQKRSSRLRELLRGSTEKHEIAKLDLRSVAHQGLAKFGSSFRSPKSNTAESPRPPASLSKP